MSRAVFAAAFVVLFALAPAAGASTFPGNNGKIVYVRFEHSGGAQNVFTVNPDGSNVTQLTNDASGVDLQPRWSADGSKIVYAHSEFPNGEIHVMNPDGSNNVIIASGAGFTAPTWSPDGSKIAFVADSDPDPNLFNFDLYVMNSDGTGITQLTTDPSSDLEPAWSPDGTKIAFSGVRAGGLGSVDILTIDPDGSNETAIGTTVADFSPRWSPDSSKILFMSSIDDLSNEDTYVMDRDGSNVQRITTSPFVDQFAAFSPDASKIVVRNGSGAATNDELFVMNPDGSGGVNITNTPNANEYQPDWQPIPYADLHLDKDASPANAAPGQNVTFTLTLTNQGVSGAPHAKIVDTLPTGTNFVSADPGCAFAAGTVTCDVGYLPPGATAVRHIVAMVDPNYSPGTPDHNHQLTVNKAEQQVSLAAGETRTLTLACAPDELVTDGSWRVDSVDQGTGTLEDVDVLESFAVDPRTYEFRFHNNATGQAQVKVWVVCVKQDTSTVDGHHHHLVTSGPISSAANVPPGLWPSTQTCPSGTIAVAPGFSFITGHGTLERSQPDAGDSGQSWDFAMRLPIGSKFSTSVRCLSTTTDVANGHRHGLVLGERAQSVTVPPGATVSTTVSCPDDAKGITASFDLPQGLSHLGNDPQPKSRVFKLHNTTGAPLTGTIDLICLADRTGPAVDTGLTNTACASSDVPDPDHSDDCDSATVGVAPSGGLLTIGPSVTVLNPGASGNPKAKAGGKHALGVNLTCGDSGDCAGTVTVRANLAGRSLVVARGPYSLGSGAQARTVVQLTRTGRRQFGAWSDDSHVTVSATVADDAVSRRAKLRS